jgi:hypothetical protein
MVGNEVVLSLRLPGAKEVITRLTSLEEDMMKEVDVLVFNHNDEYLYSTSGYDLNEEENSFTVRLRHTEEDASVDLWVIANAHSVVNDNKIAMVGQSKEDIRLLLLAGESSTVTPIPMWGTKEDVTISKNGHISNLDPVNMIRMVAKINVQMSDELKSKNNFQLRSVHFCNRNTTGCIVPDATNGNWTDASPQATAPSLPSASYKATTAHSYNVSSPYTGIIDQIYTFETAAGEGYGGADYESEPCLIIGGKYKASDDVRPLDDIPETYYRVDFFLEENYLPILRNHRYTVTLEKVGGPGFSLIGDALNAPPMNAVLEWTNDDYLDVTSDGTNYLAVSRNTIEIPDRMDIDVLTNCEGGWEIDEKSGDFYLSRSTGEKGAKVTVTATALYANENREVGYFYIVAGRLRRKIIVHQTEQDISLKNATPTVNAGVLRTDQKVSMTFQGSYDGPIIVKASCAPEGIIGTGEGSNNTDINFTLVGPLNPFERRVVTYKYAIKGVDDILLNDFDHYLAPEYAVICTDVTSYNGAHTATAILPSQPSITGWSYLTLNTQIATYYNAYATLGGLNMLGLPITKGFVYTATGDANTSGACLTDAFVALGSNSTWAVDASTSGGWHTWVTLRHFIINSAYQPENYQVYNLGGRRYTHIWTINQLVERN